MARPHPGEAKPDFMDRCIPMVMDDGSADSQDTAVAMCSNMFDAGPEKPKWVGGGGHGAWNPNRDVRELQMRYETQRAYSTIQIKSISEDQRIIEGVASTPAADRVGDIVEPMGAKFNLPMPLLWQHDSKAPIGNVYFAEARKDGIPFKARIAKSNEPGRLRDRLDEAWQSIKLGLVRAVSIGFRALESEPVNKDNPWDGERFKSWEWLELSAVTIPANTEANITTIRSLDAELRTAASRNAQLPEIESPSIVPGVSGEVTKPKSIPGVAGKTKPVKATKEIKAMATKKQTVAEQISAFEATRQAKSARMQEIMEESGEKGETLADAESQEYDGLKADVQKVDEHLIRLRELEKMNLAAAKPVEGKTQDAGTESRGVISVSTRSPVPPGIGFARMVIAKMHAFKHNRDVASVAREFWPNNPEVELNLKTAVPPADTTTSGWASQLAPTQNLAGDFIEYLRPRTLLGRIPGFTRVPFNVTIPRATAGQSGHWVGEGQSKPLGKMTFDTVVLRWAKAAGIVTFTDEIARFSNPSIEALVRDDLTRGITQFLDEQLLDPSVNEVTNISPAAITYGADNAAASGTAYANIVSDVKGAYGVIQGAMIPLSGCVWVMEPSQAVALGLMQNALSQPYFPGLGADGGTFFGFPVYTSESAGSGQITLFKPSEILLADDGGISVDVSREASLHFDDVVTDGALDKLINLWQNNLVAVRCERYITWKPRRTDAVAYITSADYGGAPTTF